MKENQPTLYGNIKDFFEGMEIREIPEDVWQSEVGQGHGRVERREVRVVTDIAWLENKQLWKDIQSIIQ